MDNRTTNTIRNSKYGMILKMTNMFGAFAVRTVLIRVLGVEYAGLDGLFTSVLTFLNMAELGFSTAIVYKLYKPIAENDTSAVCSLLNFYKKIYRIIGAIVLVVGLLIVPFLDSIIRGNAPDEINIKVLYFIYLFNTCVSYWVFAYKTALLNAYQRNDQISRVTSTVLVLKYILQIVLLLTIRSYYLYLIILPVSTLLTNIGVEIISRKHYPQYICKGDISSEDKKEITKKVTALLFNKIGVTIITASDNIVISAFLGLAILGIYDSYYYVFSMLYGIYSVFHNAIQASVGNSIILESKGKNRQLFNNLSFVNAWLIGWSSICMLCLYSPFISIWIGNGNSLGDKFSCIMAVYFYIWMFRFMVIIFKNAQGLWWEDRFRALFEGVLNLTLNLIAVRYIGIYGITLSTIVAMVIVSVPWEVSVLFSKYFEESPRKYYRTVIINGIITLLVGAITYAILFFIPIEGIAKLICGIIICLIVPNTLFFIMYRKKKEFQWCVEIVKNRYLKH